METESFIPLLQLPQKNMETERKGTSGSKVFDRCMVTAGRGNLGSCFPVQQKMKAHTGLCGGEFSLCDEGGSLATKSFSFSRTFWWRVAFSPHPTELHSGIRMPSPPFCGSFPPCPPRYKNVKVLESFTQ